MEKSTRSLLGTITSGEGVCGLYVTTLGHSVAVCSRGALGHLAGGVDLDSIGRQTDGLSRVIVPIIKTLKSGPGAAAA